MKVCFYIDSAFEHTSKNLKVFFDYIIHNSNISPILVFETKVLKRQFYDYIKSKNQFNNIILEEFDNIKSFFDNFILKEEINKIVYFNGTCEVYRPNKIIEFSKYLKKNSIKLFWVNNTFLKGRFAIYEDIVFKNSKILEDYNNNYSKKLFLNKKKSLSKFIGRYWEYKNKYHFAGDLYKEKFNPKKYFTKKFLISLINRIYFRKKILIKKPDKHNKKIILILLSKKNHWFNKYANKEINIENMIKNFDSNLPKDCLIYFKTHPKDKIPFWLLKKLNNNRSFLYDGPFLPAINFSEVIIFTGTTSGFEAMTMKKKIIHIGNNSYLNNINGPIQIVSNINDLNNKCLELLNSEIPHEKIDSYLLSLIKNSFPQMKTHKDSFKYDRDDTFVIKVAKKIINNLLYCN